MAMTGAERQRHHRERQAEADPEQTLGGRDLGLVSRIVDLYGNVLALHIADQIRAEVELRKQLQQEQEAQRERMRREQVSQADNRLARITWAWGRAR